jgi:Flp pilus assembly protein TadB
MKRILLVAAVILVAALGIFFWLQQQRTAARRLAEWEAERTDEPTAKVLSQRFKWERAELTLGEFADLIDARSGLKVEIDDASIYQNITVTVPAGESKLQDTLWMVLAPVPLVADVRGQKIVITTVANSDRGRMRTVVYPAPQPK